MSLIQNFSIKRGASFIGTVFPAQYDNISPIVIAGSGGAIPYNSAMLITLYPVANIRQGDHLYSQDKTTLLYTVSGEPEQFEDHSEALIIKHTEVTP